MIRPEQADEARDRLVDTSVTNKQTILKLVKKLYNCGQTSTNVLSIARRTVMMNCPWLQDDTLPFFCLHEQVY